MEAIAVVLCRLKEEPVQRCDMSPPTPTGRLSGWYLFQLAVESRWRTTILGSYEFRRRPMAGAPAAAAVMM